MAKAPDRPEIDTRRPRRSVAHPRRPLGADRAAPATPAAPPAGLPQPQGRRPPGHGRHLLRPPHRLPVERPERHRHLLQLLGPPPLPGVDRRRGLRQPLGQGLQEYDELKGLDWEWLAMDGAMTKAPLGGERTGRNPTDRGKLGTKRSLLTEANGVPVGLAVEGANRHDKKLAEATLESIPVERPEPTEEEPQGMCLDKGYDYDDTRELVAGVRLHGARPGPGRGGQGAEAGGGSKARRWVVERTHSWMNRFRRILIRWEKKVENYFGMLHFVCAWITYRCRGLLG